MLMRVAAVLWLMAVVGDAAHGVLMFPVLKQHSERTAIGCLAARIVDTDSITCLRIGSPITKEPILLLEIPNKLHKSDNSGRLRPSD